MPDTRANLTRYNGMIRENDAIYHDIVKGMGLSDCAFWIIYYLRDVGTPMTQSTIRDSIYAPKQTINSALKNLERDGYIAFTEGTDRRSKLIRLTSRGVELARQTIDPVMDAEIQSLDALTAKEQTEFLALLRKITDHLRENMTALQRERNSL